MGGAPMSSTAPVAKPEDAFLKPNDGVAISFWIISIAMIAATAFFFAEASTVTVHWSITVPLQMIEFNLILKAAGKPTSGAMFWKLLLGTVMMLLFGYLGEIAVVPKLVGFILGICGWVFILFEIFAGEAGGTAKDSSEAVSSAFSNMRLIVTVGWAIYPLGYVLGMVNGKKDDVFLNVTYNIADFVNKIAFVLACWSCAKTDSAAKIDPLLPK